MVNGVLIQDHSILYNFNSYKIQNIDIVREKYFYGGKVFQGVVSITTKKQEDIEGLDLSSVKTITLFSPEQDKVYHNVNYQQPETLKHIPDFRKLLFWEPNLKINSSINKLSFYTSDETGWFEVTIKGFSNNGEPIQSTEVFRVD
jgi:hypothetical protein